MSGNPQLSRGRMSLRENMNIKKEKCRECGATVQGFNMKNHLMNHALDKKAVAPKA